jgi:hypothetical protein
MHTGARRGAADARQKAEGAVGSARLLERREDQDDPLRAIAVVYEGARAQLSAVLLEEDAEAAAEADEARQ